MSAEVCVVARPHIFRADEYTAIAPAGLTVAELLGSMHYEGLLVSIEDRVVPREEWDRYRPPAGTTLQVRAVPHGGDSGKNVLAAVALLAIVVAAPYVGAAAASAAGASGTAAGLISATASATFTLAGSLAVNALVAPQTSEASAVPQAKARPSLSGARNTANPFGRLPQLLGRYRFAPPLAARTFTEPAGNDQYQRMLLCLTAGSGIQVGGQIADGAHTLTHESGITPGAIRIGDTAIDQFEDVEWEIGVRQHINLFSQTVVESAVGAALNLQDETPLDNGLSNPDGVSVVRTTDDDTDEISIDLLFPFGLNAGNKNGYNKACVEVDWTVDYAPEGTTAWVSATTGTNTNDSVIAIIGKVAKTEFSGLSGVTVRNETGTVTYTLGVDYSVAVDGVIALQGGAIQSGDGLLVDYTYTHWTTRGCKLETTLFNRRWKVPRGQYDVRVTRVETRIYSNPAVRWVSDATWTVIRSIKSETPWLLDDAILMALRIRSTDQLNGVIDTLNIEGQSVVPVWNGEAWISQPTSTPAWLYAHVLRGPQVQTPLSDTRTELNSLEAWAVETGARGDEYNAYHTGNETVFERARGIAAAGRASWAMQDARIGVVTDRVGVERQLLSPRNSREFEAEKVFREIPHAVHVSYVDRTSYEETQVTVYNDGYDKSNATVFERLDTIGVTLGDQAWRYGRYHLAAGLLRPETYRKAVDFGYLVATRGDTVRLADDVMLVGLKWGRVKTVTTDGEGLAVSVTLDEELAMEAGKSYVLRLQASDNTQQLLAVETTPGLTTELIFTVPASGVELGDHAVFGEAGKETILAKIVRIEPRSEFEAVLTLVDAAPEVLDAADGPIPPYDPFITQPVDVTHLVPAAPTITSIRSDGTTLIRDADGSLRAGVTVSIGPASYDRLPLGDIEVRYRAATSAASWLRARATADAGMVALERVEPGDLLEIQARVSSVYGRWSPWSVPPETVTVAGKETPPSTPTDITVTLRGVDLEIAWGDIPDLDADTYEVRRGPTTGSVDTAVVLGTVRGTVLRTDSVLAGLWRYYVIAIDTSKNRSVMPGYTDFTVPTPAAPDSLTAQVIDNNVLLRWSKVVNVLPIDSYEIRRGAVYETAEPLQSINATFASFFELVSGSFTYWVAARDVAGNVGVPKSVPATVDQPPDFRLTLDTTSVFDGTKSNATIEPDGALLALFDSAQTWAEHFQDNAWSRISDQVAAGFPVAAQPGTLAASYEEEIDVGGVVSSLIGVTFESTDFGAASTVSVTLSTRELVTDPWTVHPAGQAQVFASTFQYVRVRLDITGADGTSLVAIRQLRTQVKAKVRSDRGQGVANAADVGGTPVSFNLSFVDIESITVTPKATQPITPVYDFVDVLNPTEFQVYLFDDTGTRWTGPFSWKAEGV